MEVFVPHVIDQSPPDILKVTFPSGVNIEIGSEYTPTQVKDLPSVNWNGKEDTFYTLVMFDPDAPEEFREVFHWLVGNIKGNDINSGETIIEFMSSGPFKGTGIHRYMFLVYKQQEKIKFDEPHAIKTSRKNRLRFSMKKVAEKYNLGNPIAGIYYKAQWDEYVEERDKYMTWD